MSSPSWISLPPPSPSHPSRLSQSLLVSLLKKKIQFITLILPDLSKLSYLFRLHWGISRFTDTAAPGPCAGSRARLWCCLEGLPALAWLAEWSFSPTLSFPDHLSTAGESETLRMSHMYLYLAVILSCQPSVHPSDTVPRSMCSYFHLHFFCWHI